MIPLSYATILGGICTLVATFTNLRIVSFLEDAMPEGCVRIVSFFIFHSPLVPLPRIPSPLFPSLSLPHIQSPHSSHSIFFDVKKKLICSNGASVTPEYSDRTSYSRLSTYLAWSLPCRSNILSFSFLSSSLLRFFSFINNVGRGRKWISHHSSSTRDRDPLK